LKYEKDRLLELQQTIDIQQKIKILDEDITQQELENAEKRAEAIRNESKAWEELKTTMEDVEDVHGGAAPGGAVEDGGEGKEGAGAGGWHSFIQEIVASVGTVGSSLGTMSAMFRDFFQGLVQGIGSAIQGWILYGDSIGTALRKALAAQLAHFAATAAMHALYATALGFLRLAQWDFVAAGHAFASAALWAGFAGVAAIAAKAIMPKDRAGAAFNQTAAQSTGQGSRAAGGGWYSSKPDGVIDTGRNEPQKPQIVKHEFTFKIQSNDSHIVEVIKHNVWRNGDLRHLIGDTAQNY
jgi:hypothetical protein